MLVRFRSASDRVPNVFDLCFDDCFLDSDLDESIDGLLSSGVKVIHPMVWSADGVVIGLQGILEVTLMRMCRER